MWIMRCSFTYTSDQWTWEDFLLEIRVQSASGKPETSCVAGRVCCYCGVSSAPISFKHLGEEQWVWFGQRRKCCLAFFSHFRDLQLQPRWGYDFCGSQQWFADWFYPVNWKTLCLVFSQGSDGSLFSRAARSECFADDFLSISRAMEDLENNTTVFSTLRSLNNFISQRMEGVSGLATPGSAQSSLQMQYQQRMQVRRLHLGDSCSVTSVGLCAPFDSRSWEFHSVLTIVSEIDVLKLAQTQ